MEGQDPNRKRTATEGSVLENLWSMGFLVNQFDKTPSVLPHGVASPPPKRDPKRMKMAVETGDDINNSGLVAS
jgi:hypothetical protein